MSIKVNEIFGPTVQGEGKSAGMPCAFLRLALCNLHCIWCDTPHTWNWTGTDFAHPDKYEYSKEVHEMTTEEVYYLLHITRMNMLVVSGGEPFLQQKQLMPLLGLLRKLNWWIEVETNGTVPLRREFEALVNQINCSPKLSNSLDPKRLRERPLVLISLANSEKVNFKFVISTPEDIQEVLRLVTVYEMKEVRLMPEARTQEELNDKNIWVRELCEKHGFIFTSRLSIQLSGTKRGV